MKPGTRQPYLHPRELLYQNQTSPDFQAGKYALRRDVQLAVNLHPIQPAGFCHPLFQRCSDLFLDLLFGVLFGYFFGLRAIANAGLLLRLAPKLYSPPLRP